ncbi:MAG: response regulator transcription factor [Acidimicrobiales bacterium]
MISVLIVDDHLVVRAGLTSLLASADDVVVVGTAVNGAEGVAQHAALSPDIVLMDLSMPELDGVAATRQIVAADPAARVIVLTSLTEDQRILDALQAGATGYLLKDAGPDELLAAIRAAAAGNSPLDPRAARVLLASQRGLQPVRDLSPREEDVLRLVAEGLANKLIARRLGISERTVKAHLTNVFQRLGVTDRTQAALWARDNLPSAPGSPP